MLPADQQYLTEVFLSFAITIQTFWLIRISRKLQEHRMILDFIATGETGQIVSVSGTALEVFVNRHKEDVNK